MARLKSEHWFDEEAAELAVEFFPRFLRHVKGEWAGQPFELSPWQRDKIIRPIFGWKRKDGTRRYRTVYVEVPRKSGKSSLSAGIALILLYSDREMGGEVYSAAADRDQAAIVFDAAKSMVESSPELQAISDVYRRLIFVRRTSSVYRVLSADVPTKHGLNAHGIIFDELHAQRTRDLWDVLTTSTGARRQPLVVAITTAGFDRESLCWEVHNYACKVRDGVIQDDTFLPVIYGAADDEDWRDEKVWKQVNPGLGISIKLDYLRQEARKAAETPSYQNTFRRLHLNQWTQQNERWIDLAAWDACAGPVEVESLAKKRCFAGLDLSTTTDITACVLLFPPDKNADAFRLVPFFWVPEDTVAKRTRRDGVPYDAWVRDGLIETTPGNVVDYDRMRERIKKLRNQYYLVEIAIDRWNATQLAAQLQNDGHEVVGFGQGFRDMSSPTKELEKLVISKRLQHGGHPVLRWMADNVSVKQDPAGNLKPDKAKSTGRIDGIVASIMALGRFMAKPEDNGPHAWVIEW
jgi:phage terminase large subunit-like protein